MLSGMIRVHNGLWLGLAVGLVLLTALLFLPILDYGFVFYDDNFQVMDNPLIRDLGPAGLWRIFSRFSLSSYYPVRLLTFAVDYRIWGLNPRGYHLGSLVVHCVNVGLLFLFYGRLLAVSTRLRGASSEGGYGLLCAAIAAGAVGVHPLAVEPVTWIGGREELLMWLFVLLGLHHHLCLPAPGVQAGIGRRIRHESLSALLCALACMSNIVGVVFPAFLVATNGFGMKDRWRRGETAWSLLRGTWGCWPVVVVALVVKRVGALRAPPVFTEEIVMTAPERLYTVFRLFAENVGSILCPARLLAIYPKTVSHSPLSIGVVTGVLLAVGLGALLWAIRRRRLMVLGFVWALFVLAPSAQVIPHHILRADRFLYAALPGFGLVFLDGMAGLRRVRVGALALGLTIVFALSMRNRAQQTIWHDGPTLFRSVLARNPDSLPAQYNLGNLLMEDGCFEEALRRFSETVRIQPDFAMGYQKKGDVFFKMGRANESIRNYSLALAIEPERPDAHTNLGAALAMRGERALAKRHYSRALAHEPRHKTALCNLGVLLDAEGRGEEAKALYSAALSVDPEYAEAHNNLGIILAREDALAEAAAHYSQALRANPEYADGHYNFALLLLKCGRVDEAVQHLSSALRCRSPFPEAEQALEVAMEMERGEGD